MPVYVYRNLVTNETFEHQQSISDDPLTVDPRTGDPVKRLIQPVGIAFKGSGFYVNDSRSGSSSKPAAPTASSDSTASGSDSATKAPSPAPAAATGD